MSASFLRIEFNDVNINIFYKSYPTLHKDASAQGDGFCIAPCAPQI
jgi:hypothetical protein